MAAKESKITNAVVASNDSRNSPEEEEENETKFELGISLNKISLAPKRKLLVIPLAGIIVHRAYKRSPATILKNRRPDFSYGNFLVYKKPYCEEFLDFCFERFEVGLWSSAMERNIQKDLTRVLGEHKSELLFTWDQNQCTNTGFKCLENKDKPLFLKELKYIWEKYSKYSASNTLLITDPEKAILNPPNTAIFPKKYDIDREDDDFLGPKGELRMFLEGLAEAKDVQSYVKDHKYGEDAITPLHPHWEYYSKMDGGDEGVGAPMTTYGLTNKFERHYTDVFGLGWTWALFGTLKRLNDLFNLARVIFLVCWWFGLVVFEWARVADLGWRRGA